MCAHKTLHIPVGRFLHHAAIPARQLADGHPLRVWHPPLHIQAAARPILVILAHDAVVVILIRLGRELLVEDAAHLSHTLSPHLLVGYAALHHHVSGLVLHLFATAVAFGPATQVQTEVAHRHRGRQHFAVRREDGAPAGLLRTEYLLAGTGLLTPHVAVHHLRVDGTHQHSAACQHHQHQIQHQHLGEQSLVMFLFFQFLFRFLLPGGDPVIAFCRCRQSRYLSMPLASSS